MRKNIFTPTCIQYKYTLHNLKVRNVINIFFVFFGLLPQIGSGRKITSIIYNDTLAFIRSGYQKEIDCTDITGFF